MFDIHQSIFDRYEEIDESLVAEYIDGLMEAFAASPEAQPIIEEHGQVSWAGMFLDYAFRYLGVPIPKMSVRDFKEIVFELFPEKVSTEPESAPVIIAELRAFWQFLEREYHLPNARPILKILTDEGSTRLRAELANPANWGMAKSFFMQGEAEGYDMTTQEGLDRFMLDYNARLMGGLGGGLPIPPLPPLLPLPSEEDLEDLLAEGPPLLSPEERHAQKNKKRKERKAQRQARKKGRK